MAKRKKNLSIDVQSSHDPLGTQPGLFLSGDRHKLSCGLVFKAFLIWQDLEQPMVEMETFGYLQCHLYHEASAMNFGNGDGHRFLTLKGGMSSKDKTTSAQI